MITVVAATRGSRQEFATTPLGQSLPTAVELRLYPTNSRGLPAVYNDALGVVEGNVVFIHDDVALLDGLCGILDGLASFDIVGVAGSRGTDPDQPSWALRFNDSGDYLGGFEGGLSGTVGGTTFGPWGEVDRLDGLLLAMNTQKIGGLRFDERFAFHCYDTDFCRAAVLSGLRLGTWPIAVNHASGGDYGSRAFREGAARYRAKWRRLA